jgi:hypothetical protein
MTLGFVPRARSSYAVVIDVVIGLEVECGDIEMMRADRKAQKASKNTFGEDKTTEISSRCSRQQQQQQKNTEKLKSESAEPDQVRHATINATN